MGEYIQSKTGTTVHIRTRLRNPGLDRDHFPVACGYWLPRTKFALVTDPEILPNCEACQVAATRGTAAAVSGVLS